MIALVPLFGVLAGLLGVLDTVPYVRDMLRGSTRPHRGTWLIWSVLGCTVCFSQGADGATWSLVMAATQAVLTTGIFLLSLRWGDGGVSTGDWVANASRRRPTETAAPKRCPRGSMRRTPTVMTKLPE